jgi:NRAMP (natural resistance-associated macrophage protein)-like metal ion transporter
VTDPIRQDAATGSTAGDIAEPRVDPDRPINPDVAAYELESNPLKRAVMVLGPGLITGASDDDPSGIATYAQTGARYGYTYLWTTVAMLPMMISIQYICARIGLVTGQGLAAVFRQRYPRRVLYPVVLAMVVANTANAGADIGAIAAALNMIVPIPARLFVIPIGVVIVLVQAFGSYQRIARIFKWLTLAPARVHRCGAPLTA